MLFSRRRRNFAAVDGIILPLDAPPSPGRPRRDSPSPGAGAARCTIGREKVSFSFHSGVAVAGVFGMAVVALRGGGQCRLFCAVRFT